MDAQNGGKKMADKKLGKTPFLTAPLELDRITSTYK
jgi:hypothetical protein